jgi:hypothetical protein
MDKIKKYCEYLLEDGGDGGGSGDSGGGTAFASLNGNGMGNIVTPQVGSVTGSLWQGGSGTIGSGDRAAYNMDKHFGWKGDKFDKKKKKNKKPKFITKFSEWIVGPKS